MCDAAHRGSPAGEDRKRRNESQTAPRWHAEDVDPDYRIIRRVPSRFLHYYFYIRDPPFSAFSMGIL